jgi:hypothetical protein
MKADPPVVQGQYRHKTTGQLVRVAVVEDRVVQLPGFCGTIEEFWREYEEVEA